MANIINMVKNGEVANFEQELKNMFDSSYKEHDDIQDHNSKIEDIQNLTKKLTDINNEFEIKTELDFKNELDKESVSDSESE